VPEGSDWLANINPKSLERLTECRVEPRLATAERGEVYQFERLGYFCMDRDDSSSAKHVFNRSVTLRDTWARSQKAPG
jgi:glutaminyl-tRNA synthetase